jgi:4,5-DOPA dioxygenase extradiol
MTTESEHMPVLYLSHGAPPLAKDPIWPSQLSDWSGALPRPTAILMVSAHWEQAPIAISATRPVPLVYDFWGFPQHYYDVKYPSPPAPDLAASVTALLGRAVHQDDSRGLDHGAYVPLVEMYPDAEIPVLQLSMPTLDPVELLDVGRRLAPLRDERVLIVGSGFTTHNLSAINMRAGFDQPAPAWSAEFDAWAAETMAAHDTDSLLDFLDKAPAGHIAHPRTEHFAPLFVSLGAAGDSTAESVIDGFWGGLSKRSWQLV